MNKLRAASTLVLGVLALSLGTTAAADRGRSHGHGHADIGVGIVYDPFWFGAPYPGPYYYPPYYYPPPVVAVPATPPVYIERDANPAPQSSEYWYYCDRPPGYYPDVKQCPGGWQLVSPQLPSDEEQ